MTIQNYLNKQSKIIDQALPSFLPKEKDHPTLLSQAMRYAVLSGGKRIRPILALAACEVVGGRVQNALPAACALELIHSYSLVHDDLPCMDKDNTRRGKPSCHVKFGEVTALLAGDALLTLAFGILCGGGVSTPRLGRGERAPTRLLHRRLDVIRWISEAVGHRGMVGGQQLDMEFRDKEPDLPSIEYINTHKSGSLIAVSAKVGAYLGGGTPQQVDFLHRYGKAVGLLFQIVDDIMDKQGYARVIGSHDAQEEASRLVSKAKKEISSFGKKGEWLSGLADFILTRKN